jgi:hypothetical protein
MQFVEISTASQYKEFFEIECLSPEDLSPEQVNELMKFNQEMASLEQSIAEEIQDLNTQAQNRVQSPKDWIIDYEFEVEIQFFIKEESVYFADLEHLNKDRLLEAPLVVLVHSAKKDTPALIEMNLKRDWCDLAQWNFIGRHCGIFHALYDHTDLNMLQLLELGSYWVDFKLTYQYQRKPIAF